MALQNPFKLTQEERTEKKIANENTIRKTVVATIVVSFLLAAMGSDSHAGTPLFILGLIITPLPVFAIVAKSEANAMKKRLAERREKNRREEETARIATEEEEARKERERQEAQRAEEEQDRLRRQAQLTRDQREYMLRKLVNTNNYVELYDPAIPETRIRVLQGISLELADILCRHTRAELTAIFEADPDINGMVRHLRDCLQERQIRSAEAAQIVAALRG